MSGSNPSVLWPALEEAAARCLGEFKRFRAAGMLTDAVALDFARQAAADFLNYSIHTTGYLQDAVTLLCEMAALDDSGLAKAGLEGLFPALVERLNDSFAPEACALYDQVFAQVINFFRRLPQGQALDEGLRRFRLASEQDLLARKARIGQTRRLDERERRAVRKVIALSRVTLGADVAITSVMMKRLQEALPEAELVLLGSRKLKQLFGGDARVRIREVQYEREGGVMARLKSWLAVVEAVDDERRGFGRDEVLVIDPDSRLTQLGLLPVMEAERDYCFFESRSYRRAGIERLGLLAAHWVNELIGVDGATWPYVALLPEHQVFGQELCRKLRRGGAARLVSMSLGVGGNPRKGLPDPFEENLLRGLLADAALILDKGGSEEERHQINRLIVAMRSQSKVVVEVDERSATDALQAEAIHADIVTWDGGIGAFAGLIAGSDEYIGYDSAGQHIAAALGVPTLTIFAKTDAPLFAERWRPCGSAVIEVINFDSSDVASGVSEVSEILNRVLTSHHRLSKNISKNSS